MKVLVNIIRFFVGILFIISGFVKITDPIGFSYKLSEYFAADVLNMEFLQPYALAISILVVVVEIMLGVFIIIGYKVNSTLILLLGMIIFFTFLTFYSAYFNKVTDCGCFGDALKLTPWESFTKDVVLFVMILILILGRKYIQSFFSNFINVIVTFVAFILCLWYAYHNLMHLPAIDFRAYKEGVNIKEGMSVPEGAPEAVIDYNWKFTENGKEKIITTQGSYPKTTGTFVSVETELVEEGYEPPIHDFSIEKEGEDYTDELLNTPKLIVIVTYNLSKSEYKGLEAISNFVSKAKQNGYQIIGLSASDNGTINDVKSEYGFDFDFYFCDETAIKTIIRSNPGILHLEKGVIKQKLHWNDVSNFKF